MAFNPFNAFRKHQKVWFAGLTIVCMFVFILTGFGGKADPLTNMMSFFGGHHQGDKVVTLYGRDVYQSDLTRLGQVRSQVNQIYIAGPVVEAVKTVMDDLVKEQDAADKARADNKDKTADQDDSLVLRFILQQWKEWNDPQNPRQPTREEKSRMIEDDLQGIAHERGTTKSDEVRRKLDAAAAALRFEYWAMNPKPGESQRFFFGGSTKTEDLLDFMIWKYQADHLGIVLTKDDVRKEVAWDAAGRDVLPKGPWRDDAAFRPYVVQEGRVAGGLTEDEFLTAIADEYRVSIAQTLLMGHASGVRGVQVGEPGSPNPLAPFDFYTFYRDNRTTLKAAFLELPVESFVNKVTREPSEEELRRLYDKYKDALPEPIRALPAFKEPRRVEIAYVTAKPDSQFYKDKASRTEAEREIARQYLAPTGPQMEEKIDRQTAAQVVAAAAASPSMGGAAVWAGLALGGPQMLGREFLNQYDRDVQRTWSPGDQWVDPLTDKAPELHDPTAGRPAAAAALLGRALGGSLTQAGPLTTPVGAVADSALEEANNRIRRAAAAWVLGAGGGAALSGAALAAPPVPIALAAAALAVPSLPAPPPPAALTDQVFREFSTERAPELALDNLTKFIDELTKLKGRPDEAQKYVDKAVKEFGFEYHSMDRPKDVYELAIDPALKELRDAYTRPAMFSPGPKPDFVKEITSTSGVYDPKRLSSGGVVQGNGSPNDQNAYFSWMLSSEDRYVFWLSADERAHEISYDQARPEVVNAWKFQEARKLALIEANRIKAEAKAQASPLEAVKYLRDQKGGEVFELAGVSRLVSPPTANPGISHPYVRYSFPPDKIAYPPSDLLDRLMGLEKPGQTLIFKDQPEKEFYVTVLEERMVPGVKDKDFLDAFSDATQPGKKQLWDDFFVAERERDYQNNLMRQLRAEAGPIDEATGNLVVNTTKQEQRTPQGEPPPPNPADNSHGGDLGF